MSEAIYDLRQSLRDMIEYAERVARHLEGYTLEAFLADEKTIDAVVR